MSASVLVERPGTGLVVYRVSLRDRLAFRLRFASLDAALAAGEAPESRAALALRAARLIAPRMRRRLARSLRAFVEMSTRPSIPRRAPIGPHVRHAARDLLELADRLETPGPVSARGVALVCVLLSNGNGPLHGGGRDRLIHAARTAGSALVPVLPDER